MSVLKICHKSFSLIVLSHLFASLAMQYFYASFLSARRSSGKIEAAYMCGIKRGVEAIISAVSRTKLGIIKTSGCGVVRPLPDKNIKVQNMAIFNSPSPRGSHVL